MRRFFKIFIPFALVISAAVVGYNAFSITYHKVDMSDPDKNVDNATLIVMAYPEAICRTTEASYSDILPLIGIGKKQLIRAGHACLAIAREGCSKIEYFDNGRYIAPEGFCRVRGENTDPELRVDIEAKWEGKNLTNVEEILDWFYHHPEKTHGDGTLYAGISEIANYEATKECVNIIQDKNIMEYGPFASGGTNCARFVTDAIYNGVLDKDRKEDIKNLYHFTPSGLSNIEASNSYDFYYMVDESGVHKSSKNLSLRQIDILFDGGEGYTDYNPAGHLTAPVDVKHEDSWQWLGGLGYGAWYDIEKTDNNELFKVSCYTSKGDLNYSAYYKVDPKTDHDVINDVISLAKDNNLKITYPATFKIITLDLNGKTVTLNKTQNIFPDRPVHNCTVDDIRQINSDSLVKAGNRDNSTELSLI